MTDLPDSTPTVRESLLTELRQMANQSHSNAMFLLGWILAETPTEQLGDYLQAMHEWDRHERRRRIDLLQERYGSSSRLS